MNKYKLLCLKKRLRNNASFGTKKNIRHGFNFGKAQIMFYIHDRGDFIINDGTVYRF